MKPLGTGDPLRLGPYRLLGVLGEGGMGKVYVGQDAVGTVAAVKVLRPELADEANLARRFVREAQAATAVTSKGVARVLGAQTEGGRPWIATEFLAGPTLDEAVEAYGPLDEPAVRALAASLAHTLADIHAAGLIHRDLKPAEHRPDVGRPPRHRLRHRPPRARPHPHLHRPGPGHPRLRRPRTGPGAARRPPRPTSSPWAPSWCTRPAGTAPTTARTSPPCSTRSSTASRDLDRCPGSPAAPHRPVPRQGPGRPARPGPDRRRLRTTARRRTGLAARPGERRRSRSGRAASTS